MKTLILLLICTSANALVLRPDLIKTPGFYCTKENPDFKEFRYKEKVAICNRNVSQAKRDRIYKAYGVTKEEQVLYTIDHMVPLAMGGSNDELNLWPQPKEITSAVLEFRVFNLINNDRLNIKESLDLVFSVKK